MRILAIEHELPAPPRAHMPDLLREEALEAWDLLKRGIIRDLWFTSDHCAVIMLECLSATEARKHLATLPLVRYGQIDFTLLELHAYDGFERLFARSGEPPVRKPEEPAEY